MGFWGIQFSEIDGTLDSRGMSETLKPLDVWILLNGTPRLQATSSAKEALSDSVKDLCQRLGRSYATCISARSISVAWQKA
jgi:hypothetical protein